MKMKCGSTHVSYLFWQIRQHALAGQTKFDMDSEEKKKQKNTELKPKRLTGNK